MGKVGKAVFVRWRLGDGVVGPKDSGENKRLSLVSYGSSRALDGVIGVDGVAGLASLSKGFRRELGLQSPLNLSAFDSLRPLFCFSGVMGGDLLFRGELLILEWKDLVIVLSSSDHGSELKEEIEEKRFKILSSSRPKTQRGDSMSLLKSSFVGAVGLRQPSHWWARSGRRLSRATAKHLCLPRRSRVRRFLGLDSGVFVCEGAPVADMLLRVS